MLLRHALQTDLVIEARSVVGAGDFPLRKMPCRVTTIEPGGRRRHYRAAVLPANDAFRYRAGQYVEFILKGRQPAQLPDRQPAAHPGRRAGIEPQHPPHAGRPLHRPRVRRDTAKEILRLEGPLGSFFIREDSVAADRAARPGTGFAPIKAIVGQLAHAGQHAGRRAFPLGLPHAGRLCTSSTGPPMQPGACAGCASCPCSPRRPDDAWTSRTGLVHEAVMADPPDPSRKQVQRLRHAGDGRGGAESATLRRSLRPAGRRSSYADAFT